MRGLDIEPFALHLMQGNHAQLDGPLDEIRQELRDSLTRIVLAELESQNMQLSTQASNPNAFNTLKRNIERTKDLRRQLKEII